MRFELLNHGEGDEGEYLEVDLGVASLSATVQVEDSIFGRHVTVIIDGKKHAIEVPR